MDWPVEEEMKQDYNQFDDPLPLKFIHTNQYVHKQYNIGEYDF